MAQQFDFDGFILSRAIQATFERRNTALPTEIPLALTDSFSEDRTKKTQWDAFIRKNRLEVEDKKISDIAGLLRDFLIPPLFAMANREEFNMIWPAARPWRNKT